MNAQTNPDQSLKNSQIFIKELKSFISHRDSISSLYNGDSRKYMVFVANIYFSDTTNKNFCFTLGYILNSNEFLDINPQYYMDIDRDLVLIKLGNGIKPIDIDSLNLKVIKTKTESASEEKLVEIIRRLFPYELGGFSYTSDGLTFCESNGKVYKNFYKNSDLIPKEISIWYLVPTGYSVKLIKQGTKF